MATFFGRSNRRIRSVTGLLAFLGLTAAGMLACTSLGLIGPEVSTDPCQNIDWFEVGRRDGVVGRSPRENPLLRQCERSADHQINTEAFEAGFNKGLVEYCTPERAFQMGQSGQPYSGVCPAELENEVVGAHLKGKRVAQRLAELEEETTKIEMQIEALLSDRPREQGDPSLLNELGQLTGLTELGGLGDSTKTTGKRAPQDGATSAQPPMTKKQQLKTLRERRAQLNIEIQDTESGGSSNL